MIEAIAEHGKAKGTNVDVLDVSRPDWLRNAAGLLDLKYWRGELEPLPTTNWYMDKLDAKIAEATATSPPTVACRAAGRSLPDRAPHWSDRWPAVPTRT